MEKKIPKRPSPANSTDNKTILVMVAMYCRDHHHRKEICADCKELLDYAIKKLQLCPLKEERTTCGTCHIHCYKPEMKNKIREVMRYAGLRMIKLHPLLAFKHIASGLGKLLS